MCLLLVYFSINGKFWKFHLLNRFIGTLLHGLIIFLNNITLLQSKLTGQAELVVED